MSKVNALLARMQELSLLAENLQKVVDETPTEELQTSVGFIEAGRNLQRFCHEFGQGIDIRVIGGKLKFTIYPLSSVLSFPNN